MESEIQQLETITPETQTDADSIEWETPDLVEHSACAEICAYVFSAV
jgi:hypothetical protein